MVTSSAVSSKVVNVVAAAQQFERALGDPLVASNPVSFERAVILDEQDEFPEESRQILHQLGFFHYLIPHAYGGKLRSCEELLALTRVVARRDLTAAIAIGQVLLGALPVWLAGNDEQTRALAEEIMAGHLGCLALTEKNHGSDLMGIDMHAQLTSDGYLLSGEKWMINNASRGHTLSILAKTPSVNGRDELTIFFLLKSQLNPDQFSNLPKFLTHGIHGADISGIRFDNCRLAASCVLDKPGAGFVLALKTLQISRILCAGFSLGAADTALRTALTFARSRQLYGSTVANIPAAQTTLLSAYFDLLIADAVAITCVRAIDCCRQQLTLWSAIAKYFVPVTADALIRKCSVVLGARHYMRGESGYSQFQKLMRDAAVVALFDGSTAVNLGIIAAELNVLSVGALAGKTSPQAAQHIDAIFNLQKPLTELPLRATTLALGNEGKDDIMAAFRALAHDYVGDESVMGRAIVKLEDQIESVRMSIQSMKQQGDFKPNSAKRALLAERYAKLFSAACCTLLWLHNKEQIKQDTGMEACLGLMLWRILGDCDGQGDMAWLQHAHLVETAWQHLTVQHDQNTMFSFFPLQLAQSGAGALAEVTKEYQ